MLRSSNSLEIFYKEILFRMVKSMIVKNEFTLRLILKDKECVFCISSTQLCESYPTFVELEFSICYIVASLKLQIAWLMCINSCNWNGRTETAHIG